MLENDEFTTRANYAILSWHDLGNEQLWAVRVSLHSNLLAMTNVYGATLYVPRSWPVVNGDLIEIERFTATRVCVRVLAGKEKADAADWFSRHLFQSAGITGGGA